MINISVIIPCYNSYKFMDKCINSLENQLFKNFEVIFVDDCSSDDTYIMLNEYLMNSKLTYKIIKNKVNIGPGGSRNIGIKHAVGEYVTFMDSDDWYELNFLELMYKKACQDNLDIVMCDYFRAYDNGKKKKVVTTKELMESSDKNEIIAKSFDSLCCMMIKKYLFENTSIPNQFNAEDVAIIPILIAKSKKIGCLSESIYNYFYRKGSLSTSINENVDISIYKAFKYIEINLGIAFENEVEFIGIKNILYGAVICCIQVKKDKKYIERILVDFEKKYPNWIENKYIKSLPKSKRLFLYFLKRKNYFALNLLSIVRTILFEIKLA